MVYHVAINPPPVGFWGHVGNFFFSNFFLGLTTLAVAFVALLAYNKQKIDSRKVAATIILLEIKNAETKLALAKDSIVTDKRVPETTFVMKTASWSQYSHLFVRDFTDKEWELINTFYEKCQLYDEAVEYQNSFVKHNGEQTRVNVHRVLSEYTKKYREDLEQAINASSGAKHQEAPEELRNKLEGFTRTFLDEAESIYARMPKKAFKDAEALILTIKNDLSTTTIGIKLGRIANQNFRSRVLRRVTGTQNLL